MWLQDAQEHLWLPVAAWSDSMVHMEPRSWEGVTGTSVRLQLPPSFSISRLRALPGLQNCSTIAVQVWKPPRKSFIHINPESRSIVPGSFKINLNITPFRKNVAKCLTLHYTWSQWGQTFVTEFSSTIVQHNLAYQLNIGTFLPKGYHHLILQTGTQHRKRLEMTQGVNSWQTGRHCPSPQSAQLWFFTDVP